MPDNPKLFELIRAMEDARSWVVTLQTSGKYSIDSQEVKAAEKTVMTLESKARAEMISLGCTNPDTRKIQLTMADMLIQWYTFIDGMD